MLLLPSPQTPAALYQLQSDAALSFKIGLDLDFRGRPVGEFEKLGKKMLGLMRGGGEFDKERLFAFLSHNSVFPQKKAADIAGKQDLGD